MSDSESIPGAEPIILHRPGVVMAIPRPFRSHPDEIDALLGKPIEPEQRKASMAVDLGLFGFAWGRDALDEVYRRASEWMDREGA